MKTGSVDVTGMHVRKRTSIPCTVPAELQLKFQDLGSTVTNWDRIRLNRKPNYSL